MTQIKGRKINKFENLIGSFN